MPHPSVDAATACGLPAAWHSASAWTVLDLEFGSGSNLLETWRKWRDDPHRPTVLHYVGIFSCVDDLTMAEEASEDAQELETALRAIDFSGRSTFHRVALSAGRLSVTLCAGPINTALGQSNFSADSIYMSQAQLDLWSCKLLARRSRRGTRVSQHKPSNLDLNAWEAAGFKLDANGMEYQPEWSIVSSRKGTFPCTQQVSSCAVVGAGLAGSTIAHALALRGWQVRVYDEQSHPAMGASGLPVGLVAPHHSKDDDPQSQLSRSGTRLLLALAKHYLQEGLDWHSSGILELSRDPKLRLNAENNYWHTTGAWIKPAQLVNALLAHENISFVGNSPIVRLEKTSLSWNLMGSGQSIVGKADHVVLANATGFYPLVQASLARNTNEVFRPALQTIYGTISHGVYLAPPTMLAQPTHPVNGNGSYIPNIPTDDGLQWFTGATYTSDPSLARDIHAQHRANYERLFALLPDTANYLKRDFDQLLTKHWSNARCVTSDRLPLVGALDPNSLPGIWCSIGMGSRGLSLSALCAELLAARMGGEPWPIETRLAKTLDIARVAQTTKPSGSQVKQK